MKKILLLLLATVFCGTLYAQYPSNTTKTRNLATGGLWWTNGSAAGTYDGRGRIYDTTSMAYLDSVGNLRFLDGTIFTSANLGKLSNIGNMLSYQLWDGQRKELRPFWFYAADSMLFNGTKTIGNDYYRNPNVFKRNNRIFLTYVVTKGHDYTQGSMRLVKYNLCGGAFPCGRFKYTTQVIDTSIRYENNILAPNILNDTIYGIRYTVAYPSDTILKLDTNFNRIGVGAVYFDKAASNVHSSFLSLSKIIKDDSGYFYMAGYERITGEQYNGVMLRSRTRNSIENWDTLRKYYYVDNSLRLEECAAVRGAGDTILFLARNDFGNRTMIAKCIYGNCSQILSNYKGANQPKGLTYSDSIILATGRIVGTPSLDNEIKTLNDTLQHGETFDYRTYTSFSASWDYGNNWYTFYLDRIRTEAIGTGKAGQYQPLTSEVADIVQLAGDTFRVYWASGIYVDLTNDYGDLNYTDFIVNRYQRGDIRFIGGITKQQTTYSSSLNLDSLNIVDSANRKYFAVTIDNRTVNLRTNSDTIRSNAPFHKFLGAVAINTPILGSGRTVSFSNTAGSERLDFLGGNSVYGRWGGSGPAFVGQQGEGTFSSPIASNRNRIVFEYRYRATLTSGTIDLVTLKTVTKDTTTTSSRAGSEFTIEKVMQGSASARIVYVNDSTGKTGIGNMSSSPTLTYQIELKSGDVKIDSALIQSNYDSTLAASYYWKSAFFHLDANATSNPVTVFLPPASTMTGKTIHITKIDASANAVTITAFGGQTINGSGSISTTTQNTNFELWSNGNNWRIH